MNVLPSNLALQRTRPAMAQHATFRLTKRTFSETATRRGVPHPRFPHWRGSGGEGLRASVGSTDASASPPRASVLSDRHAQVLIQLPPIRRLARESQRALDIPGPSGAFGEKADKNQCSAVGVGSGVRNLVRITHETT